MMFEKPKFWNSLNLFSLLLLPLSLITSIFNFLKSILIKEYHFKVPIICVGNIFIGGTGKTPLSVYIYNLLKRKRFNPSIIRKYYSSHLDEIKYTKNKVKHFFTDKDRFSSISKAVRNMNDVIIMDDGLQDISIKKDLNIVCFNSMDLVGNGFLLPAGPLRERLKRLGSCHLVVINGKRNKIFEKKLKMLSKNIKIFQSSYKIKNIQKYKNQKLLAFAGIGNPYNFFKALQNCGLKVKDKISFPDHYHYTKSEIKDIILKAKAKNLKLVTTEKDYFRIKQFGYKRIDYISVDLKITNNKSFEKEILKCLW